MEGRNKNVSPGEARRLRKERRAKSRRRKAGLFIVLAAVAALLVGLNAGGLLPGKGSQPKAGKNPKNSKHVYASVLQPAVNSNRVKAPSTFPPTIANTTYRDIASQLPGLSQKDIEEAHQSVLDPSWASIRVKAPDRDEGYYAVFLKKKGKSWQPERSVLIDQNTYPKDPNAVLRDVPRDLSKTLEFPQQTSGSAANPADFATKVIENQTAGKGKWTAGKVRKSGDYYVVPVEDKKNKKRHTNVYLTSGNGLYSVSAIGQDITSTEAPGFPKDMVKQEKTAASEKARFRPR